MVTKTNIITLKLCLGLMSGLLSFGPLTHAADEAQPSSPAAGERAAAIRERMQQVAKELNLTEEQKVKLKPIIQEEMKRMREVAQDQSLSRRGKLKKLKALRDEFAPQIKQVLTEEQYKKWQKMASERRGRLLRR